MSAAIRVFADINSSRIGVIDVDLESTAMAGSRIERFQKHRLASLGLEVLGAEILDTLVQLVKAPHLRLLAQKTNDGAERHGEEAEEDINELLVGFCKQHLLLLLVNKQLHVDGWRFILSHGGGKEGGRFGWMN